jgi:hypothetical protein
MDVINLGLIGAGRWGRNYIKTIAGIDGVRLTHLGSRNPASKELVDADCAISANWRELLDARDLDGIIVATPPALHAEMVSLSIAANIPVLVEKPLTLNFSEANKLLKQSRERCSLVMVGHTHLFNPAFEELCRLSPSLGVIRTIRAEAGNHGPYRSDVPVLWDWGSHDIAMCIELVGSAPLVRAAVCEERRKVEGGIGESIRLQLEWPDGKHAHIKLSNIKDRRRRFTVFCNLGVLVYDDLAQHKLVIHPAQSGDAHPNGDGTFLPIPSGFPLTRAVERFVDAIRAGDNSHASLGLGVDVIGVLADCERIKDL